MAKQRILEKKVLGEIVEANRKYNLIRPGDEILVAVSGGKDSLLLAYLLEKLRRRVPFVFGVSAVTLDMNFSLEQKKQLTSWMNKQQIQYSIESNNILSTIQNVVPSDKIPCSACARFRRGILYNYAYDRKMVLAFGHHADDAIETLLMNIFFSGKIQALPPVLLSNDKRNRLIRPLILVRESSIVELGSKLELPVVSGCDCPGTEFLEQGTRKKMKNILAEIEKFGVDAGNHFIRSMQNIKVSNMMDSNYFDYSNLNASWELQKKRGRLWKGEIEGDKCSSNSLNPNELDC
ncbi:MAG: ATP-binding protein [Myxococcota bacterium]